MNNEALQAKVAEVFREKWEGEHLPQYADLLEKFVFHMCDASSDICALAQLLGEKDGDGSPRILASGLHRFFLHALPHLVAAGQIYDYVPRLFAEQDGVHELPNTSDESCVED